MRIEPGSLLPDRFRSAWANPATRDAPALADDTRQYSYAELLDAVGCCAGWLRAAGVRQGDRVALAMERSADFAICILGAMVAGACPCPLEPGLGAEEAQRRTRVAGFRWIVFDTAG